MKKIAIITAAFNAEKYLGDCALSVSKSITNDEFEIEHIIVNDASTDGTSQVLAAIPYPNVKKLNLAHNKGPAGARNEAIKNTDAEYLFCLDSDDVIFQNSLKSLFEILEKAYTDWVYGDFVKGAENLAYLVGQDYYGRDFPDTNSLLSAIFAGEHYFQQNSMYKRELFNEVGGFDERMMTAEDLDLFVRFILRGHLPKYQPGSLYIHRVREGNWTATQYQIEGKKHSDDLEAMRKRYFP